MLLSQCLPAKVTVTDPALPAKFAGNAAGLYWHDNGTFDLAPAGTWLIRNAIVDRFNKIGPWSPAAEVILEPGWLLMCNDSNVPDCDDRAGIVWKATRQSDGLSFYLVEGQRSGGGYGTYDTFNDPVATNAPYPWSSNNHQPYILMIHGRKNAGIPIGSSSIVIPVPDVPSVWPITAKMNEKRIRWSWHTHSGETEMSPELVVPSVNPASCGLIRLCINAPIPPGALGRFVYVYNGTDWQRVKAAPWREDYLFDVHDNQPIIWAEPNGPLFRNGTPDSITTGPAWSVLSPVQVAKRSKEPVVCDVSETPIYHPIVDEYDPSNFRQQIAGQYRNCQLVQKADLPAEWNAPNDHSTYWPMMVIQNQNTILKDISFKHDLSRGPGASCAITAADFEGGQAFNLRAKRCSFWTGWSGGFPFIKAGLHIGWGAAGKNVGQHTASEWYFEDCTFGGQDIHINLQGTQTVNFVFHRTHLEGFASGERACILIDGAAATFTGGLYASKVGTLFGLGWDASVDMADCFIDKSGVCLVDFNSYQVGKVRLRGADTGGWKFISRSPCTTDYQWIDLRDWKKYRPTQADKTYAYHCSFDRLTLLVDSSPGLAQEIKLAQADREDWRWRVVPETPIDRTPMMEPAAIIQFKPPSSPQSSFWRAVSWMFRLPPRKV